MPGLGRDLTFVRSLAGTRHAEPALDQDHVSANFPEVR